MKSRFNVGDRVRLTAAVEPYGSNYAGSPKVILQPGQEGVVGTVDVPVVRQTRKGHTTFCCVDFFVEGVFHFGVYGKQHASNQNWRAAVYPDQMELVTPAKKP
jgi:hypothetical protein